MEDQYKPRKIVGKEKEISPLERAFNLRTMVLELRGNSIKLNDEHIRKTVGGTQPKRG